MRVFQRLRLLPLLILVALMSFAVRLGDLATGMRDLSGGVLAESGAVSETVEKSEPAQLAGTVQGTEKAEDQDGAQPKNYETIEWPDAAGEEAQYSGVTMELFKDLAQRRKELEARERNIVSREAILEATERELDRKISEMQALRKELETLLDKQSGEEEDRIRSLVKVYEGMKSKDAARIFNTLDIDILVEVMGRMSERKLSPILADMDPERARAVTIILARQKKLPELPVQ